MNSTLFRTLLIYGIVVPLAIIVGWVMSSPENVQSIAILGVVVFVLALPIILKFHYAMLVFSWNATLSVFFLPGQPSFWTLMVVINIAMAVGYRILQRRPLFISAPAITASLLFLVAVVIFTAQVRGGIGMRSLGGGQYGGRQYFYLLMGVLGYFAFASQRIDLSRIGRYRALFYLSGTTGIISNIIFFFPSAWFLYLVFPVGIAAAQAQAEFTGLQMNRLGGLAIAGGAVAYFLLAKHGLRGVFTARAPWRAVIFIAVIALSSMSGYRSTLLGVLVVIAVIYMFEGLLFTRWTFVVALVAVLMFCAILPFASKLPLGIQRSLSVLPIDVNPIARYDAQATLEWRVLMWKAMLPDLPKYLFVGKGYTLNPTDMFLTEQAFRSGLAPDYMASIVAGDYHNGPLSVYVPFGAPGVLAFLIFLVVAGRALWLNFKFGAEVCRTWNTFLLALFVSKVVMFVGVFGSLHSDLFMFTGILGLSVALNGGVCRKPVRAVVPSNSAQPFGLQPSAA